MEQVERRADTDSGPQTMRRGYLAMKSGSWQSFKEEYRKEGKLCEWTFERIREACEKVAMDDIVRLGIAHEILRKTQTSCGGSSRQPTEWEESLCRTFARIATVSPWRTTFGGYRRDTETATTGRRSIATGGVRLVEANTNGERPTGYWWYRSVSTPMKRRCSKCTQRRWGDNLINALKLLANQQKDGDSTIQSIATGLHEIYRRGIMDGLTRFFKADNHRAVDVGHMRQGTRSLEVQKLNFSEAVPEAAIREGADELTLSTTDGGRRWLMRTGMHAFCHGIYKGIEGEEWEEM